MFAIINNVVVVGCGGIAAHLLPTLVQSQPDLTLSLIDGDKVERKNLQRQMIYRMHDVGYFKVTAMATCLKARAPAITIKSEVTKYLAPEDIPQLGRELLAGGPCAILCCADNHAARKTSLLLADTHGVPCLIGANEAVEAEAYWYDPKWKGTGRDPRIYYPGILVDASYNPTQAVHCSGMAEQTATANMLAAGFMLWLLRLWGGDYMNRLSSRAGSIGQEVYQEVYAKTPSHVRSGMALLNTGC